MSARTSNPRGTPNGLDLQSTFLAARSATRWRNLLVDGATLLAALHLLVNLGLPIAAASTDLSGSVRRAPQSGRR
jgi:hypothetical protein